MVKGIETTGTITATLKNVRHRVLLDTGQLVIGYESGHLRRHHVHLVPGDYVKIELGQFDLTLGRIIYRYESKPQ